MSKILVCGIVAVVLIIVVLICVIAKQKAKNKETTSAYTKLMSDSLKDGSSAAGKAMAKQKKMKNQKK